ncbi:hypothetical protein EJ04DRAFT_126710 [Polyplosphaeria fusca]|uniref:Uncharacterized protein n=1 Tax=Polyplosphaeria fusca TaxID=682080 RepID=A0A9P4R5J2_9PLEO|nr:hypothetical protein EJ04DRAFT_126710 [Polyplosphaeria fusca]
MAGAVEGGACLSHLDGSGSGRKPGRTVCAAGDGGEGSGDDGDWPEGAYRTRGPGQLRYSVISLCRHTAGDVSAGGRVVPLCASARYPREHPLSCREDRRRARSILKWPQVKRNLACRRATTRGRERDGWTRAATAASEEGVRQRRGRARATPPPPPPSPQPPPPPGRAGLGGCDPAPSSPGRSGGQSEGRPPTQRAQRAARRQPSGSQRPMASCPRR